MKQDLRVISDETVGVVKIREDSQFNKIKAEKVIVDENVTVRLFGSVKTIVVKKGAKLFLHGVFFGNIENNGGEVYIFGK
ncbi:MAG: hypothetical protein ACXVC6_09960 [Bacteroidia bacterium]